MGVQYWILNHFTQFTFIKTQYGQSWQVCCQICTYVLGQELRRIWYNDVWQNKKTERTWKKNGNDLFIIWMEFLSNWDNEKATYLADTFMGSFVFSILYHGLLFFFDIKKCFFFLQLKSTFRRRTTARMINESASFFVDNFYCNL